MWGGDRVPSSSSVTANHFLVGGMHRRGLVGRGGGATGRYRLVDLCARLEAQARTLAGRFPHGWHKPANYDTFPPSGVRVIWE